MKTIAKVMLLVIVLGMLASCASLNVPVAATSNELGAKVGKSGGIIWFGIFGNVDAGIQAACQDGGILEISSVDFKTKPVLFGVEYTCTVTGK